MRIGRRLLCKPAWLGPMLVVCACQFAHAAAGGQLPEGPSAGKILNYGISVADRRPHSRRDFTQGLEIHNNKLYQGTGRYGQSRLQVFDFTSGKLVRERRLPGHWFGEGITLLDEHIYQLTWRAGILQVYSREDLEPQRQISLPGEGWGLTNNGQHLIYSDGSSSLHFLTPGGKRLHSIEVRYQGRPVPRLNELEWAHGYLLANIWAKDWIIMINSLNGEVFGRIDLAGLLPRHEQRPGTDILNGIALDRRTGKLWVTGKNWPWIYQVDLVPRKQARAPLNNGG